MKSVEFNSRLDNIGITASTLCAIHCAIVPLIITALPLIGLGFLADPWFEWGMIMLALIIGVSSLSMSYFRAHRRSLPLTMLAVGFFIIISGHLFIPMLTGTGWIEGIIVPLGGLTIAAAHFVNYKYVGICHTCSNAGHVNTVLAGGNKNHDN